MSDVLHRADTAAQLDRRAGFVNDLLDDRIVLAGAVLRAVQINHMNQLCARCKKALCGVARVLCYLMCSGVIAAHQTDTLAVL